MSQAPVNDPFAKYQKPADVPGDPFAAYQKPVTPANLPDMTNEDMQNFGRKALTFAPAVGATLATGFAPELSLPAMAGIAALGGAGGEGVRQGTLALTHADDAPKSFGDAAINMGQSGLEQGVADLGGRFAAKKLVQWLSPMLDSGAQSLTKSALKGGYATTAPADQIDAAARAMRENRIPFSPAGKTKLSDILVHNRQQVETAVNDAAQRGATINPQGPLDKLDDLRSRMVLQVNPTDDIRDLDRVRKNFADQHTVTTPAKPASTILGPNGQPAIPATPASTKVIPIPADEAQAIKVGTNVQNADKYGKLSHATIEGEKALNLGMKEGLESGVPDLKSLNPQQANLMGLQDIFESALNKYRNSPGLVSRIGPNTGVAASLVKSTLGNPAFQTGLAQTIDRIPANMDVPTLLGARTAANAIPPITWRPSQGLPKQ